MKRTFTVLIVIMLGFTSYSYAQPGGGGRGMGGERIVQMYKDSLNLTDVQVDSVKAILKDIQPLQREIAMNQEMSRQDKALALKEVNEQRNARLKAVLTKEQFEKLKDMEQRRREQMRERAAERFDGNRGVF